MVSRRSEPNRANVTITPSRLANAHYIRLLLCGRTLKTGFSLIADSKLCKNLKALHFLEYERITNTETYNTSEKELEDGFMELSVGFAALCENQFNNSHLNTHVDVK